MVGDRRDYVYSEGQWVRLPPAFSKDADVPLATNFSKESGIGVIARRRGDNVTLTMAVLRSSSWTGIANLCTLPDWARPSEMTPGAAVWGNAAVEVKAYPDGTLTGNQGATARLGLVGSMGYTIAQ